MGEIVYESDPTVPSEVHVEEEKPMSQIPSEFKEKFPGFVLESVPKNATETPRETYNRLRSELYFLHEQIDQLAVSDGSLGEAQSVDLIRSFVSSIQKQISGNKESNHLTNEIRFNQLEKRITALEWTLGLDKNLTEAETTFKTVQDLKTRIQILAPNYLQKIHTMLQEKNKANQSQINNLGSKDGISKDDKGAILEVEALVKRWDERCKQLAPFIEGLKTSEKGFQDVERVVGKYNQLVKVHKAFDQTLNANRKLVQSNLDRNQERLQRLGQRIKVLKESKA